MREKELSQEDCKQICEPNSVLQTLNAKHLRNLSKLKEINIRISHSVLFLGGDFIRNADEEASEGEAVSRQSHISSYNDLLNSTEYILNKIFEEIQRLEYLVVDKNQDE